MAQLTNTLTAASRQWMSRPADERFLSLLDMQDHFDNVRAHSRGAVVSSRVVDFVPQADHKGLVIRGAKGVEYAPTHHAFNQLASLVKAPAAFLRTLPAELTADILNYQYKLARTPEDVGLLLYKNGGDPTLRAATGPRYGRIWNADIVEALVSHFGDGITGDFRVPGEFGVKVDVTKENTTLYAGDRDMFVFLADEVNRIEIPNRRNGESGTLARGFFVWNSEVGATTFGVSTFLFDYACKNRIVWGAQDIQEIRIRHTASAPDRYLEEIAPALRSYARSSTKSITDGIAAARAARVANVDDFLAGRFGARAVSVLQQIHQLEEGRPIETLWDVATAVTARARSIEWQDERVEMEREAGKVLMLA